MVDVFEVEGEEVGGQGDEVEVVGEDLVDAVDLVVGLQVVGELAEAFGWDFLCEEDVGSLVELFNAQVFHYFLTVLLGGLDHVDGVYALDGLTAIVEFHE